MEISEGTQSISNVVRYVTIGGVALVSFAAGSLLVFISDIIRSSSKEPAKVADAIAKVKQKREEIINQYGSEIADLVIEAEKKHAASHAYPYVRHNHQILDQENATYNGLLAIARQLKIPETELTKAQQLHESANGKNYVRPPQLLQQEDANYELSLAILEHIKTVKNVY